MADLQLSVVVNGVSYAGSLPPVVAPALVPEPVVEPAPVPAPEPVISTIPLLWDNVRFASNIVALSSRVVAGGTIANKSITDTGQVASIVTGNGATVQNCRVKSREGIRIGGSGNFLIDGCYIEVNGTGDDHADGVQAYAPGSKGIIKGRNNIIKCGQDQATAGMFVADNWTGDVDLENFVFQGGPFGLRLHADKGGDINVSLKDVFFVGPFKYSPFYFLDYGGRKVVIQTWENVRTATIQNSVLVPGNLIARP